MNTFLTLLATYYVCAAIIADGPLTHQNQLRCSATSEALRIGFLTEEEQASLRAIGFMRGTQTRDAFLRFESWELDNAELVSLFREEAKTVVIGMK